MTTGHPTATRPEWLPESVYPYPLRTVSLPEQVTYVDVGSGPTLLFVHTGLWSYVWASLIQRLSVDHRCITLDFPGQGVSPDGGIADLASQRDILTRFATELDLSELTLVLHDLGGPVGMGLAALSPTTVRRLAFLNTFFWEPDSTGLRRMLRLMSRPGMARFDRLTGLIPRLTATRFGVCRHLDADERRGFLAGMRVEGHIERFHELMGSALDSAALFAEIDVAARGPLADRAVLTIYGEKNDPFGFQDRIHGVFDDHRAVQIPGGNHFPMMDAPDTCAEEIRRFVAAT